MSSNKLVNSTGRAGRVDHLSIRSMVKIAITKIATMVIWLLPVMDKPRSMAAQGPADVEDQTLRAMFTHGLAESALNYVRARARLEGRDADYAWWVMREMECHARWALLDAAGADEHWADCDALVEQYKNKVLNGQSTQTDPRWPWIEWQVGRCRLLKAQALLAVYAASPANTTARDQSLELIREISQRMDELTREIKRRQPLAARQSFNNDAEAPADQLRNLEADSQLLLCEALMVRWQLYPIDSEDRAASLAEVRTIAIQFLRTRTDAEGRAALEYAAALAELESGDQAALTKLEQLSLGAESLQIRMLAASSLARSLARSGQQSRARLALDILRQIAALDTSLVPQSILTQIEVSMIRLESGKAPGSESDLAELVKQAQQLGTTYGDYWRMRAEAILVGKLSSNSVSDSKLAMDLLLAEVRQLTAKGDAASVRAAAEKLLQGRDAQATQGRAAAAILLARQAASLFRTLEAWEDAVNAVQDTAVRFPEEATAADAHLSAVEAQIPRLKQDISNAEQRKLYVQLLQQQIRLWPESAASQQAKRWLREWCWGQGQRRLYVESILEMMPACKNSDLGQLLVLECSEQTLQLNPSERAEVIDKWLNSIDGPTKYPLAAIAQQAAFATVILADVISLDFPRSDSTRQRNWTDFDVRARGLNAGLISEYLECAADVARVQLQLPASQASASWNQLNDSSRAAMVVALVDALDAVDSQPRKAYLSSFNLDKDWAGFDKAALSPTAAAAAERIAYWLSDASAGERLKKLAEKHRRDGSVQLIYAYWLAEREDWGSAKKIVTQLAGLSATASSLQLTARWALMRFQMASGESSSAAKAARLLLASQPNLDSSWVARLKAIDVQAEASSGSQQK